MARGLLCWSGARPKDKTGDGNTVSAASLQKRTHTKKTIAKWTTGEAKNPVLNSGVGGHPPGGGGTQQEQRPISAHWNHSPALETDWFFSG